MNDFDSVIMMMSWLESTMKLIFVLAEEINRLSVPFCKGHFQVFLKKKEKKSEKVSRERK